MPTSVALYEFITGGGWSACYPKAPCPASLAIEGKAMLSALASDFSRLADVETRVLIDREKHSGVTFARCQMIEVDPASERETLAAAAQTSDWTLIIAPEFDSHLSSRARWVCEAGGRLLGPPPDVIELTSNKDATARSLNYEGFSVPLRRTFGAGQSLPHPLPFSPAVLKPQYGAGSQDTFLLDGSPGDADILGRTWPQSMCLERFIPGEAVSVALLGGPAGIFPLPPCRQHLSTDGRFRYQGGSVPLEAWLAARASRLALRAAETLERFNGYIGIDLVLGDAYDGAKDVVIEINPRLTTSYVGLRALSTTNLAQAMLDAAQGRPPVLAFHSGRIEFTPDGRVSSADG